MPEHVSEHVLKYRVDDASVNKAVASVDALQDRYASLKAAAQTLGKAAGEIVDELEAINKAAAESRRAQSPVDGLADAAGDVADEARKAGRAMEDAFDGAAAGARRAAGEIKTFNREQNRAVDLYGDVESRTRAITGAVGYIGGGTGQDIERTANIGAELFGAAEGLGKIKDELPDLINNLDGTALAMGGAGIAIGLGVLAINKLREAEQKRREEIERSRQAIREYTQDQREYYEFIAGATEDDVRQRIEDLEERRRAAQLYLANLEADIAEGEQRAQDLFFGRAVELASGLVINTTAELDELEAQAEGGRNAIAELDVEIARFQLALEDGATAAADAAVRERELAAERERQQQFLIDRERERTRLQIEAAARERTWTQAQLDARLTAIEAERQARKDEKVALRELRDERRIDGAAYIAAINETNEAIRALNREQQALLETVQPAVAAREAEAEALEAQQAALERLEQAEADRLEALRAEQQANEQRLETLRTFLDDSLALEAEREQQLAEDAADFQRQRVQDLADHYADQAKLDAQYFEKRDDLLSEIAADLGGVDDERLESIQDFNRETERLAEDHHDRLRQIQERAQGDFEDAARRRDTAGALAALRRGENELDAADDQYQKEQERRQEDFELRLDQLDAERDETLRAGQQALRDLENQHRREKQERAAAFRARIRREDDENRVRLQRQQAAWNDEDRQRRQHYAAQLGLTAAHFNAIYNTAKAGLTNTTAAFQTALNTMYGAVTDAMHQPTKPKVYPSKPGLTPGLTSYGGYRTPGFKLGGDPPLDQVVKVGEEGPEYAVFQDPVTIYRRPTDMPSRATTLNVNLGGLGGVQLHASAGTSAREIAGQAAGQLHDQVLTALEQIIDEYAGVI